MSTPDFVADAMLGRLARWLRVLGLDTRFDPAIDDKPLVSLADTEARILLTRDRHLVQHLRPRRAVLLRQTAPLAQLREVAVACDLGRPDRLFTRCLVCNTFLRAATPVLIDERVPPKAREPGGPYLHCPGCDRIYWPGTHVRRMREELAATFPHWFD